MGVSFAALREDKTMAEHCKRFDLHPDFCGTVSLSDGKHDGALGRRIWEDKDVV